MEVLLDGGALPFDCRFEPGPPRRELYLQALAEHGRGNDPGAYNLVATRDWMLFVARRQGSFGSISVNGLGFAGAFLAKDDEELARLREVGPMTVLREVSLR
jgi:ATP adenylyltransferase